MHEELFNADVRTDIKVHVELKRGVMLYMWSFINKIVIMYLGHKVKVYYNECVERDKLMMETSAVAFSKPECFTLQC